MARKLKIRKGDNVVVTTGKDSGKTGEVLVVFPDTLRVLVRGVNIVKRHTKPSQATTGGIMEREASIHISNVSHVDPKTSKASKVGYRFLEDGRKVRFARGSGEVIDA
ncbi:MAG: 50S ribosomal protein L24 [Rhodospirillaceae bacterium]|jgi:large subunit ribosomal protein L24|nr:50S ribosomal protein L24 [Rhodospirillaceae bacterium]MDG1274100.1 50S ribosomal protein L24 [Alphaproteobacteria bacterium]MDG1885747.1 50S ribosomal protein L24 [Alphaproteobacteria bacterium]|tara:strand:+ start:1506 stop:1829 length:324 start_codon:yes stop_codon:yes gene_type:complete